MSYNDDITYNDRECEYDIYGDTRNNPKHNEEKPYKKNSYNHKIYKKINNSIMKKQMQKRSRQSRKRKKKIIIQEKDEKEEGEK